MKTRKLYHISIVMLLILAAFLLALPALAQDSTPEAPVATAEPTAVVPVNVNINTTPANESPTLPEGNVSIPGWAVVTAIVLSIGAGYSLPRIIDAIRRNPQVIREIETRVDTLPEPVTTAAFRAAEVLESAAELLKEATDRIAASSKPSEAFDLKTVPDAALVAEMRGRGYQFTLSGSAQGGLPPEHA